MTSDQDFQPAIYNNFMQQAGKTMRTLSQKLEQEAKIKLLSYNVGYDDNTGFLLSSNLEFMTYRAQLNIPLPGTFLDDGLYFWDDVLDKKYTNEFAERFGIIHGMWLVKRHQGGREVFSFCLGDQTLGNTHYINNINTIENFCYYFKDKAKDLIKTAQGQLQTIPDSLISKDKPLSSKLKINLATSFPVKKLVLGKAGDPYLTEKEKICFIYFLLGKTAKEIAAEIDSSPKTVESHLRNVKQKLNCKTRSELLKKAWEMKLLTSPLISND